MLLSGTLAQKVITYRNVLKFYIMTNIENFAFFENF